MMSLKKLCPTFILTLVLATSALAGDMEAGITAPPTPPAAATTQESNTETPSTPSDATGDATSVTATVTEAALALIGSVVALF